LKHKKKDRVAAFAPTSLFLFRSKIKLTCLSEEVEAIGKLAREDAAARYFATDARMRVATREVEPGTISFIRAIGCEEEEMAPSKIAIGVGSEKSIAIDAKYRGRVANDIFVAGGNAREKRSHHRVIANAKPKLIDVYFAARLGAYDIVNAGAILRRVGDNRREARTIGHLKGWRVPINVTVVENAISVFRVKHL
jgi:hypothetical protein